MSLVPYVHVDAAVAGRRAGELVVLSEAERHHLRTVLRLGPGAEVEVADGDGGSAAARLEDAEVRLVEDARTASPGVPTLTIAQALPKGRKLDEVVRQVTELGVDGIQPVTSARCVTRLEGAKLAKACARWNAVARGAAEQARRPTRPSVAAPVELGALRAQPVTLLLAHPGATPLPDVLETLVPADHVVLAVGPEGGWADSELAPLFEAGAAAVGLGPNVLRTEHAAAAGIAVLAAKLGRWR